MPKMDGCELARRFRANPALRNVVLIALTGWGQEEDRRQTKVRPGSTCTSSNQWNPTSCIGYSPTRNSAGREDAT